MSLCNFLTMPPPPRIAQSRDFNARPGFQAIEERRLSFGDLNRNLLQKSRIFRIENSPVQFEDIFGVVEHPCYHNDSISQFMGSETTDPLFAKATDA